MDCTRTQHTSSGSLSLLPKSNISQGAVLYLVFWAIFREDGKESLTSNHRIITHQCWWERKVGTVLLKAVVWSTSTDAYKLEYIFCHTTQCDRLLVFWQKGQTRFHRVKHFHFFLNRHSVFSGIWQIRFVNVSIITHRQCFVVIRLWLHLSWFAGRHVCMSSSPLLIVSRLFYSYNARSVCLFDR